MLRAISITKSPAEAIDTITLDYEARYRRRVALTGDNGTEFLLDLAAATELRDGDGLLLEDGGVIRVVAAAEDLMEARSPDRLHLIRTAWHVGNRHLPCQILADRLVLRWDHVIAEMLEGLGCTVSRIEAPFTPEGGAYGLGRTHGHDHGHGRGAGEDPAHGHVYGTDEALGPGPMG